MQQQVIAEQVGVEQVEREQQIKVQEAEITRRERELDATVLKSAEIERQRIETLANAEKMKLTAEAEGQAAATRARGDAEADIIFKKGDAEARAMNVKAEAFQEYNQAAVVDKLVERTSRDRSRARRAVEQGRQDHDRVHRRRRCRGRAQGHRRHPMIAAQVPALFETLSGMQMSELLSKVRQIGDTAPKPEAPSA